jgi:hypothetical protein
MDDASPENMLRLEAVAKQAVEQHSKAIDSLCLELLREN